MTDKGRAVVAGLWPGQRPVARLTVLALGLGLYGVSEALMLAPAVGVDPWDVFHTGLTDLTGIPVGTVLILVGAAVLLLWIPLRQRPGLGTVANVVVIGGMVDLLLGAMPVPHALWLRWAVFLVGVLLNAVATGLYIGARLGAGPRDGLTTALAARGRSIRLVRTGIELAVLAVGWLLGGDVGPGTVVYALIIGPLVHVSIPRLRLILPTPTRDPLPTRPEPTSTHEPLPTHLEPTPTRDPVPTHLETPEPAVAACAPSLT